MGIRQLSSASAVTGSKSNKFWNQSTYVGDFVQIASVVVTSGGTGAITFSGIPQTFTNLQLRSTIHSNSNLTNSNYYMTYNSDSSALYTYHALDSYIGGTPTSGAGTGVTVAYFAGNTPDGVANTNIFAGCITDIFDYSNTNKFKTAKNISGWSQSSSYGGLQFLSTLYRSTNAINSLTINTSGTTTRQYSRFDLYGVR